MFDQCHGLDEEILAAARRKVFLDIDPGFGQMWRELGLADILAGHDAYVTVGTNVGGSGCIVPTCGLKWISTVPSVVLDNWPMIAPQDDGKFTSVVTWRGIFGPIEFQGSTYGLRVHEFRKFIELPRQSVQPFELALDIHPSETADLAALERNGLLPGQRETGSDPGHRHPRTSSCRRRRAAVQQFR
jgi:hypothetical protein